VTDDRLRRQWLEDQRGPRGLPRAAPAPVDRLWWTCLSAATAVGLLSGMVLWGWRSALVVAAITTVLAGFVVAGLRADGRARTRFRLTDIAVTAGLILTGLAGLVAAAGLLGLALVSALAAGSPVVRRRVRAAGRGSLGAGAARRSRRP
jgi:hypothetical protein